MSRRKYRRYLLYGDRTMTFLGACKLGGQRYDRLYDSGLPTQRGGLILIVVAASVRLLRDQVDNVV